MELIAAVYEDWGIGCCGTQPVTVSADRVFFREMTRGAAVVMGRKTAEDFPGRKPLPGRKNILLTGSKAEFSGFQICSSLEELLKIAEEEPRLMVIGGGSVYRQLLPYCDTAYITKLHCCPKSDTFFPNLDMAEEWKVAEILQSGEENGISYEMIEYKKESR